MALAVFGQEDLTKDTKVEVTGPWAFGKVALDINVESEGAVDAVPGAAEGTGGRRTKTAVHAEGAAGLLL